MHDSHKNGALRNRQSNTLSMKEMYKMNMHDSHKNGALRNRQSNTLSMKEMYKMN